MLRFEIVLHDLLKQRQDELGLVRQRVFAVISIAFLHVQRVDAYRRRTGNVDHTAAERADHRRKLSLRVEHEYIIVRREQHISDFLLNRERLACTGYAQPDTVTVQQVRAVGNNEIARNGVIAIADTAHLLDFLCRKRREDRNIVRNERALLLHTAQSIRENGIQTNVLLVGQFREIAAETACNLLQAFCIRVKLLQRFCRVDDSDGSQHQALVMLGNIVHVISNNLAHLLELIRDFRREIIVVVLSLLPAGNVGFDAQRKTVEQLMCFLRVDRFNIHGQHHLPRQAHEIVDQLIRQARCELLDKKHAHKALVGLNVVLIIPQR